MGARLIVFVGAIAFGLVFVGNLLLLIESVSMGRSIVGPAAATIIGGAIAAACIWALSLESLEDKRDPFGRARFEEDRKAAEKAGLK